MFKFCSLALVLGAVVPQVVMAQTVPSSAQTGIIMRSLEKPAQPLSNLDSIITVPADTSAVAGSTQKVFVLNKVVLQNSSAFTTADFAAAYAPYMGKKVSFADLNTIIQNMTRQYREAGYVFSRVVLPPQKIKDGVVYVNAVEGRVGRVDVVGEYNDDGGLIKALADKIRTSGPANTKEIERYLLLIDDLPGVTAKAFIKPSSTQGAGDLTIAIEEDTFEGSATVENRGSRYIGPWRADVVGAFNNVFGLHDRTTLRVLGAQPLDELKFGEITHEQQIGSDGLRVKGRYAVTATEPGGALSSLGIQGDSNLFDLETTYPLLRGRQMNLSLLGGFTHNDTTTDLSGLTIANDRVRTARLGGRFDLADALSGVNQFELTGTKGLDWFNASDDGLGRSRANAEHDGVRFNATASRLQALPVPNLSLYLSATGQYSHDPLLASEEFTVGGGAYGRAFDAGELAGDKGYATALEVRYGEPVDSNIITGYELYSFVDYGKVSNINPVVGEAANDSLTSVGVGTRFNLAYDMSGYVELNQPINKTVSAEGDSDPRVFVNLSKRF
jgi:hemolysin activation/secretion protein